RLASTQPAEPAPTMMKSAFMLPSLNSPGPALDGCRASFETPVSRAPQDDVFFFMPRKTTLMLRSAQMARLDARPLSMQRSRATSNHLVGAECGDIRIREAAIAQHGVGIGAERR